MLETIQIIIAYILLIIGSLFLLIGAVGLIRMPDVFTRMHAVSVMESTGASLIIIGLIIYSGFNSVSLKLIVILLAVIFISSVATHALARACIHDGIKPLKISRGKEQ
ncbi:MAG: monovalent cation/H(+) antiporter subunit G [Hyphomicrobiales bacterium]|jgi:multicomponent Na+:H+ antiporter subunit G|nr:monovalent cation/H(+) antiporter subunit G [Hyphomicrobiales bacterium]|tara:strand:- start:313 stop:636 length:324 start_codon:yes stop_codon:yes gene_type:complete